MVAVSRAWTRSAQLGTVIGALCNVGYDYVLCVENEDRDCPGLEGFDVGWRHLAQFLP